jgi:hypothetical protein
MRTEEQRLGKHVIRWQANADGSYSGTVISAGKSGKVFADDNRERLLATLRNFAGTLEPNYFGIDGAITRFLEFMPGGFQGERILEEREYKLKAHQALDAVLGADKAGAATPEDASKVRAAAVWINLLSPYESMHLKAALESSSGPAFLQAAARFASGDVNGGGAGMRQAMRGHGALTWPIATYFPFLWNPAEHMFLKPTVTRDFAERIGHPFQYDYAPDIDGSVYQSLIDLAQHTKHALASLKPRDYIDVQSFIWVVGAYTDADRGPLSITE